MKSFFVSVCVPTWPRHCPLFVSVWLSPPFPSAAPASSFLSSPEFPPPPSSLLWSPPALLPSLLIRLVRRVSVAIVEDFVLPRLVSRAERALGRMGQVVWSQLRRASDSRLLACARARMRSACTTLRSDKGSCSPNYSKVEPSVLSPKAITSDFVHPASALISSSLWIVL